MRDHTTEPATEPAGQNGAAPSPADLGLLAVFAALPGPTAVFAADPPHFTLLVASDALLAATGRSREALVGRPLAEAFPDPQPAMGETPGTTGGGPRGRGSPGDSGLASLRASLAAAIRTGAPQRMARQRYDLRRPDGAWEVRYWDALNTPVRGGGGAVRGVLHQTEDVTEQVRTAQAAAQSEVRAARVLERMGDAHVALDREFRFMYVNAAGERALGKARGEMLGRTHWVVFPASVDTDAGRAYRRVVAEGVEQHLVQHYVGEGYDRHLEIDAYPTDEGGVAVFWRDVTARVRAEADVARFQRLAEHSNDAQYLIDEQGRIRWANRLASERMGHAPDELTRLTVGDLNPLVSTEAFGAYFARARRGRVAPFESVHRRKDGSPFPVEITPTVVELPEGARMLAAVRDITERKQAEAERARLLAESERARAAAEAARAAAEAGARAKAEFLATMSHEIRTPINAIVGYTQLLELGIPDPATPAQQQQLARVTASAQHLLGLVNDVLDVAKVDAGALRVAREHAATGPAVATALALVRPLAGERGVRLVGGRAGDPGHPDDPAGVPYVGDEARVRQVLVNLLSNAVKFTPAGGTVTVASGTACEAPPGARVEGAGPWAYVRVADTGVGIAPAQQAAVFEPFVQAEAGASAYTRTAGGTGLGLTISRRLARLMGGDLTLESTPGAGSTFTLWLPVAGVSVAGSAETPAARGERAGLPGAGWRVHGLAEIGRALREETDAILEAYEAALRADPAVPGARGMARAPLEDHAITLLADLAQSLVIVAEAGEKAAALTADGTAIQRTIAEHHGARRFAQGWAEEAVRRDHAVLHEVVERAVRARVVSRAGDVSEGLRVLAHLQARTEALSLAAYRHAREHAGEHAHGAGAERRAPAGAHAPAGAPAGAPAAG